jgi:large conductance mechanosensitive channel
MGFEVAGVDPKKRTLSLLEEFKNFAFKGNVIDLAVGIVIGTAFTKIVDALVKSIIMPLIGAITGGGAKAATDWVGKLSVTFRGVEIPYGVFIAEFINFIILAFVLFLIIRKLLGVMLSMHKKEAVAPPPPPPDVQLLTEIRDLLKARANP